MATVATVVTALCGTRAAMADGAATRMATGIAGLFAAGTEDACRLLDAGAGIGALSDAYLRRWLASGLGCQRVAVDACENDEW